MLVIGFSMLIVSYILEGLNRSRARHLVLFVKRPSIVELFIGGFIVLAIIWALKIAGFVFLWKASKVVAIVSIILYLVMIKSLRIFRTDFEKAKRIFQEYKNLRSSNQKADELTIYNDLFYNYFKAKLWSDSKILKYKNAFAGLNSPFIDLKKITLNILYCDIPIDRKMFPNNSLLYTKKFIQREQTVEYAYNTIMGAEPNQKKTE